MNPKILILSGDGINCERETARAFMDCGADTQIVHVNELVENPSMLGDFQGMALPGGFSFGDELGSGQVLSLKLSYKLKDTFKDFVKSGKPVIGICNGFQVLTKLGLFSEEIGVKNVALAHNEGGHFIDQWIDLKVSENCKSPWVAGMSGKEINLPVRHGEGRLIFESNDELTKMKNNGQVVLCYGSNINGSTENIAGICDPSGLVFGLMPHPEAFMWGATANKKMDIHTKGDGYQLFENIIRYIREK